MNKFYFLLLALLIPLTAIAGIELDPSNPFIDDFKAAQETKLTVSSAASLASAHSTAANGSRAKGGGRSLRVEYLGNSEGFSEGIINGPVTPCASENYPINLKTCPDVDADGDVAPIDVLVIINELRRNGPRLISTCDQSPFYDVNRDGYITPADVLSVINYLKRNGSGSCTLQYGTTPTAASDSNYIPYFRALTKNDGSSSAETMLVYDGDSDASSINYSGLGTSQLGIEATKFTLYTSYVAVNDTTQLSKPILEIDIYSGSVNKSSRCKGYLPDREVENEVTFSKSDIIEVPFSSCTKLGSESADFKNVGAITLKVLSNGRGLMDFSVYQFMIDTVQIFSPEDYVGRGLPVLPSPSVFPSIEPSESPSASPSASPSVSPSSSPPPPPPVTDPPPSSIVPPPSSVPPSSVPPSSPPPPPPVSDPPPVSPPPVSPPPANCEFYTLKKSESMDKLKNYYDEALRHHNNEGKTWRLFEGEGAKLSCLDNMVQKVIDDCKSSFGANDPGCVGTKEDGYWMNKNGWMYDWGDDILMRRGFLDESKLDGGVPMRFLDQSYMSCKMYLRDPNSPMGSSRACDYLKTVDQPYHLKHKFIDKNCNFVDSADASKLCGDLIIDMTLSPISLEISKGISEPRSIVKFDLSPDSAGKWILWKGSKNYPLLSIDLNGDGKISNGSELFGNWTFGGKLGSLSKESNVGMGPWRDGFEALETLDINHDKVLSKSELNKLSLWFDENRNAVTEEGELRSVISFGIEEISLTAPSKDMLTKDLRTEGSVRSKVMAENGELLNYSLVDWYTTSYSSPLEATLSGVQHSNLEILDLKSIESAETEIPTLKDVPSTEMPDYSGIWAWRIESGSEGPSNSGGYLMLRQDKGNIWGMSMSQVPAVSETYSNVVGVVSGSSLYGGVMENLNEIEFVLPTEKTRVTSNATLVDKDTLKGSSVTKIHGASGADVSYNWIAKRLTMENVKKK